MKISSSLLLITLAVVAGAMSYFISMSFFEPHMQLLPIIAFLLVCPSLLKRLARHYSFSKVFVLTISAIFLSFLTFYIISAFCPLPTMSLNLTVSDHALNLIRTAGLSAVAAAVPIIIYLTGNKNRDGVQYK
jgi:predicted CDP-diglyceride synthetase/phosphatidate cytidylyltransferase